MCNCIAVFVAPTQRRTLCVTYVANTPTALAAQSGAHWVHRGNAASAQGSARSTPPCMLRLPRTGQLCTHTGMRLQPRVTLHASTFRSCKVCVPPACGARGMAAEGYAAREPLGRLRSPGAQVLRRVQAPVQSAHVAANALLHVPATLPLHCSGCACRGGRPTTGTSGTAALPARCRLSRCAAQVAIDRTCGCPSMPVRAHWRAYRAARVSINPFPQARRSARCLAVSSSVWCSRARRATSG